MNSAVLAKKEIITLTEDSAYKNRINIIMQGDEKKAMAFKSNLANIAVKFAEYSMRDILNCALELADLGLSISSSKGMAYIVPYSKKIQPVISYRGWIFLAERAGKIVKYDYVFKCDDFNFYREGFNDHFTLKPNFLERRDDDKQWFLNNLLGIAIRIFDKNLNTFSVDFVPSGTIKRISGGR